MNIVTRCDQTRKAPSDWTKASNDENRQRGAEVSRKAGSATTSGSVATSSAARRRGHLAAGSDINRAARQIAERHERRAVDRGASTDQAGICQERNIVARAAPRPNKPATAEPAQDETGQDRDVSAGDRDDVKGPRLLQTAMHILIEPRPIRQSRSRTRSPPIANCSVQLTATIALRANDRVEATRSSHQFPGATTSTSVAVF